LHEAVSSTDREAPNGSPDRIRGGGIDSTIQSSPTFGDRVDGTIQSPPTFGNRVDGTIQSSSTFGDRVDGTIQSAPIFGDRVDGTIQSSPTFVDRIDGTIQSSHIFGDRVDGTIQLSPTFGDRSMVPFSLHILAVVVNPVGDSQTSSSCATGHSVKRSHSPRRIQSTHPFLKYVF